MNKNTGYIMDIRGTIMEFPQSGIKHYDLTIIHGDMPFDHLHSYSLQIQWEDDGNITCQLMDMGVQEN